ncbi:bifunctional metallophosphatase/5'-nucleotidase [Corallococcus macrosporus]|uniref:Bifunctional metallophosphatase/5'-nucleotidase n=2 Tax=Myxococcaceae TaxID=31 RepID=A0A250K0E2_9BACT|nr:bifunctional UDP-sugar hydrolase/5'-nucleotidase [Corallococcus macrosporus]AEI68808.1 putative 5`-nucleotidase [Corallococcus macrosporus]ATB49574.1 bifunctional metallophosphatase/5'-nucleotidase [Corallococcus macrosporus DSM 14697]
MKKKTALARREALLALAAALAGGCAASAPTPTPAPPSGTVRLTLLHLADVYQVQAVEDGQRGGMARAATLRKQVLRETPHVLTLMGGDTLSPSVESLVEVDGKPLKGRHMVDAWNAFGLDYAVLGNHEFDFGDDVLRERIRESRFTWLGANVRDGKSGALFAGVQATAVRELGGIKLGLFGVVLQETKATTKAGKDTHFGDVCEAARGAVAKLREQGAQVVVALTHLTADQDRALTRCVHVDAVLGGHDHEALEDRGTGTPIFKVAADAVDLGRLTLDVDAATATVRQVTWQTLPVTRQVPEDAAFVAAMQPYATLFSRLSERVGRTPVALDARASQVRTQETNLGSFVADAFRAAAGADVALVNGGALRADTVLPAGGVTRRDLHAILPYTDELVVLEVKGDTLRAALENGVSLSREDSRPGRFPQVSGMAFTFDADRPVGQRVLGVKVGGKPLDAAATYRLATLSFLASGKDGYDMLKNQPSTPARADGNSPLDVLAEAFRTGTPSPHAQAEGRISRLGSGALSPDARQPPAPLK